MERVEKRTRMFAHLCQMIRGQKRINSFVLEPRTHHRLLATLQSRGLADRSALLDC